MTWDAQCKILSKFIHVLFKSWLRIYQHRQTKTDQHCNSEALKQLPGKKTHGGPFRCFTVKRNSVYLLFCIRCVTSNVRCWLFWVTAEQSTYLSQFSVFLMPSCRFPLNLSLANTAEQSFWKLKNTWDDRLVLGWYPPFSVEQRIAEPDTRLPLQVSWCSTPKQAMLSSRPAKLKRSLGSRQGEKLHDFAENTCGSSSSGSPCTVSSSSETGTRSDQRASLLLRVRKEGTLRPGHG